MQATVRPLPSSRISRNGRLKEGEKEERKTSWLAKSKIALTRAGQATVFATAVAPLKSFPLIRWWWWLLFAWLWWSMAMRLACLGSGRSAQHSPFSTKKNENTESLWGDSHSLLCHSTSSYSTRIWKKEAFVHVATFFAFDRSRFIFLLDSLLFRTSLIVEWTSQW